MEKKFETNEEFTRVQQCVGNKIRALHLEAQTHSATFDTQEHYLGHYEMFPFVPTTTVDECLE